MYVSRRDWRRGPMMTTLAFGGSSLVVRVLAHARGRASSSQNDGDGDDTGDDIKETD